MRQRSDGPDRKPWNVIAGTHPAAVDMTAAMVMGFDWVKLRLLKNCFSMKGGFCLFQPSDIHVASNKPEWDGPLDRATVGLGLRRTSGGRGDRANFGSC